MISALGRWRQEDGCGSLATWVVLLGKFQARVETLFKEKNCDFYLSKDTPGCALSLTHRYIYVCVCTHVYIHIQTHPKTKKRHQ